MIRIGVLGTARAADYVNYLQTASDIELIGIVTDRPENKEQQMANSSGAIIRYYPTPVELFEQNPDGVIICSTIAERLKMIEATAGKTRYVLCEAPLAPSIEGTQSAVTICKEYDTLLQPAFALRFLPVIQTLKQLLDENKIGQILCIKAIYQKKRSGADSHDGVILKLGIHIIDLLCWLFNIEVVDMRGEISNNPLTTNQQIEDAALLSILFTNATYAIIDLNQIIPDTYPADPTLKIELIGSEGSIRLDAFQQAIVLHNNKPPHIYWGTHPAVAITRDFLNCIRNRCLPSTTGLDALRAHKVIQAAYYTLSGTIMR